MLNQYKKYNELISDLKDRTSKLWLMYLEMVDILCAFIKGERTGDWNLHLQSMANMLPFLASSGQCKKCFIVSTKDGRFRNLFVNGFNKDIM